VGHVGAFERDVSDRRFRISKKKTKQTKNPSNNLQISVKNNDFLRT
jgi:hypothetical protein